MESKNLNSDDISDELLIDYIFKLLPPDQEQALEQFLDQSDEHATAVDELLDYCLELGLESKAALEQHLEDLRQTFRSRYPPPPTSPKSYRTAVRWLAATAATLALLLAWQWVQRENLHQQLEIFRKTQAQEIARLKHETNILKEDNIRLQKEILKLRQLTIKNNPPPSPAEKKNPVYAGLNDAERKTLLENFIDKSKTDYLREAGQANDVWKQQMLAGQLAEALTTLKSYLKKGDRVYGVHYFFAGVLSLYLPASQGGNLKEAVYYLELANQHNFTEARPYLVVAYAERGDWTKAIALLRRFPEAWQALPHTVATALAPWKD